MHNILHVSLTPCRNESRLLKQCASLANSSGVASVTIAALWEEGLLREEQVGSDITIRRIRLRSRNWGRSLPIQVLKYLEFLLRVLVLAFRLKIDVISCHALALLPLGALVKMLTRARLVYDAHELETERAGLQGLRKRLSKIIERGLIGYCDYTFVVSECICDDYRDRYGITRISTVMNCPPHQDKPPKSRLLRDAFNIAEADTIFLYQGLLDEGRGLPLLINAFRALQGRPEAAHVHLVIMGYGPMQDSIVKAAKDITHVHLQSSVPPQQVLRYTASADIGVSLIEPICLSYAYSLPNKLFEYLVCGLHVLSADLPEIRRHADALNVTLLPELTPQGLADQCLSAADKKPGSPVPLPERYSWEYQSKVMMKAYDLYVLTRAKRVDKKGMV